MEIDSGIEGVLREAYESSKEFHDVASIPDPLISYQAHIVNLLERLAIARTKVVGSEWILQIMIMDVEEEIWSKTYSISVSNIVVLLEKRRPWFTPVDVSEEGDLSFMIITRVCSNIIQGKMRFVGFVVSLQTFVFCLLTRRIWFHFLQNQEALGK